MRASRRLFSAGVLLLTGASVAGCSTTTTALAPVNGRAAYHIECIHAGECWTQARRACGGDFRTLEQYDNRISESDLPGLNERTAEHAYLHHDGYLATTPRSIGPYGPGFESDRPFPLTGVVVLCSGS